MPLPLQVKLLRALEERKIRPVGSHEQYDVDVRVIAATHRKLEERIASGEFREDLYYRLNVVKLYIPTLAERPRTSRSSPTISSRASRSAIAAAASRSLRKRRRSWSPPPGRATCASS